MTTINKNFFIAPSTTGLGAMRWVATLLLAVMMLTTAQTAWAQTTITPTTPSQDGDGNYLIGTAAELYGFAEIVNSGNASANAKLTADIVVNENVLDANGEANTGDFVQWTPIGNDDNSKTYSGTFDGQGHTVSGLYVSGSGWYVGLIGKADGTAVVRNLGIVDSYFSSSNNFLGSIVGGVSYNSSVTLANVYSTSTVKGDNWIGGLVGSDGSGSVTIINSYFAGKTSAGWSYGAHHDDLVSGGFGTSGSGTLDVVNTFVVGTSQYGTSVTAKQLSDGTVAAALHYYQDALADGSMFGINDGKTTFSGSLEGVSVTTADITLHTFDGDATAYSSKYVVGNTTPLPVNVVRIGYKFAGWYDNADLEGDAVTQIPSSETGNKEYWAKFERSHSVTFVLNDGYIQTGEIDHYIEGETTALPTMVFNDGASFEGWYTTEDFTGDRYYFIPATATEDMTFYAKWGAAKTTFYLVQGGSPEPVNILYEGENTAWLDKTTAVGYYINDNQGNIWGGFESSINVPYTGGESTFGNGGREFYVSQSGFYVFTLTDKGEGNWFISVLYPLENYCTVSDTPIPDQTYTGSAITPAIDIETTLTLDTDYTIEYSDNTNVGTATVTITGIGNYGGTIERTFTIVPSTIMVSVAGSGTVTIGDKSASDGEAFGVMSEKGASVVLTLAPESGNAVRSVAYGYTNSVGTNMSGGTLPISDGTATLTVPNDLKDGTGVTLTVTFAAALVGGPDEASAVALTDATVTDLAGGWYKVESDITFDHTLNLLGDTHLTIADGKTMTVSTATAKGIDSDYTLNVGGAGALSVTASGSYPIAVRVGSYVQTGATVTASGFIGIRCQDGFTDFNIDNDFTFSGGQLTATGTSDGIWADNDITISCTNASDFIQSSSYDGTIKVADGKALTDGTNIYSGTLTASAINGKTLRICLVLANNTDNDVIISNLNDETIAVMLQGRTLYKDGSWNTLCLPFSVDLTATDCPLYGATARTVTAASVSGTTLNLTFGDAVNTLEAGMPYIIKWDGDGTSNIENPVFKGVTIEATKNDYDTNAESVTTDERVRFCGTYKSTAFDAENKSILLMGSENTLYYPAEGAGIGSFRAYFKIGDDDNALLARRLTVFSIYFGEGEEEATGIVEVEANTSLSTLHSSLKDAWHTLDGRRLQGKPTQGGIYIKNGKKITVK